VLTEVAPLTHGPTFVDEVLSKAGSVGEVLTEVVQEAGEVVAVHEARGLVLAQVLLDGTQVEVVGERVGVCQVLELVTLIREDDSQLK